jgi:hypothetical protein
MAPKKPPVECSRRIMKEAVKTLVAEYKRRSTLTHEHLPPVVPFLGVRSAAGGSELSGHPRYWDDARAHDTQHTHWGWRIMKALKVDG